MITRTARSRIPLKFTTVAHWCGTKLRVATWTFDERNQQPACRTYTGHGYENYTACDEYD